MCDPVQACSDLSTLHQIMTANDRFLTSVDRSNDLTCLILAPSASAVSCGRARQLSQRGRRESESQTAQWCDAKYCTITFLDGPGAALLPPRFSRGREDLGNSRYLKCN